MEVMFRQLFFQISFFFQDIEIQLRNATASVRIGSINYSLVFEVILLVADLPATASLLNMHHHLATFGRTLCLIETQRQDKMRFYPLKKFKMRTPQIHEQCIETLERCKLKSFKGVKGRSKLFDIIPNLPLTAPVDVMHQVYLGVTKVILQVIVSKTVKKDIEAVSQWVQNIQVICFVLDTILKGSTARHFFKPTNDFKRKLRTLRDLEFFKANELRNWLLYFGPVLFSFSINDELYERFMLLSYSIRLMMLSRDYLPNAEKQLNCFLMKTKEQFGEQTFSANLHSLTHLPWQVRHFGPLWTVSAMMFESANYLLQSNFSGTVNHLPLLVERYQRNKQSMKTSVTNDNLRNFCHRLRNTKNFRRKLCLTNIPKDLTGSGDVFYSNCFSGLLMLDSLAHSTSKNSCFCFRTESKKRYGQARIFFVSDGIKKVSVQLFDVIRRYKSSMTSKIDVDSYVQVNQLEIFQTISVDRIESKYLLVEISENIFLVPLLQCFEHD